MIYEDYIQISIIVPIYNVAEYLKKCISSILAQTYKNLQIILVDDGSTDGSSQICDDYAKTDKRIEVIHKQNGGLVSARKSGLQIVTGNYVGYVDGDDWIEPDMYEKMIGCMLENSVDMVETQYFLEAGAQTKYMESKLAFGIHCRDELIPIMLCDDDFNECRVQPYLWSKLFKRELLMQHQMQVDESILCGEDMAVVFPYLLDCSSICVMKYAGYHYVQRQYSMTSVVHKKEKDQNKALIKYLKEIFERNEKYDMIMLQQLNQYTKSMLLIRDVGFFDMDFGKGIIKPFNNLNGSIAVYGAGRMGKSLYRYFRQIGFDVVAWGDKDSVFYQQLGLPVVTPEEIINLQEKYDKLLIAVISKKLAELIAISLRENGLQGEKIMWLNEEFIDVTNNVLTPFLEEYK